MVFQKKRPPSLSVLQDERTEIADSSRQALPACKLIKKQESAGMDPAEHICEMALFSILMGQA